MRKKCMLLFIIFLLLMISACRPSVQDQTLHYGIGAGWYQEGKTPQEMINDFNACKSLARENDNNPFIENDCMRSKGYTVK